MALTDLPLKPWRIAADPAGGIWVLDAESGSVGRLTGLPLPHRPEPLGAGEEFSRCEPNPHAPHVTVELSEPWPGGERPVALACSPRGRPAVLTWDAQGAARLYELNDDGTRSAPVLLEDARYPYSMAWLDDRELALMSLDLPKEALVYDTGARGERLRPSGEFHPLHNHTGDPFLHGVGGTVCYPTTTEPGWAPLHPISLPSYAHAGTAYNADASLTQSSPPDTTWHRIYLEAAIPPNCAIKVYLGSSHELVSPENAVEWHEHHFGTSVESSPGVPRGAWVPSASELPFNDGLLDCPAVPNRAGLFTALVQRSHRRVSSLRGRFLQVRVELIGDGRSTPELAALRVYGSRFSYVERYLPNLYKESLFGPDADAVDRSTPADFLERMLDNFEGMFTPLEDRIASSYLLTDPRTTDEESLEWLGSWVGVAFDPDYPRARRRDLLEATPELYRTRGTVQGFRLALDVATGGACGRGEIVVLEDFRLRRTFATILGADLADEDDPLLAGLVNSGNSYVGDSLFLGDESRKEFLALYTPSAELTPSDELAVQEFLERLAFQVTVLVHAAAASTEPRPYRAGRRPGDTRPTW